ncbi:hypothetical protein BpHYR1_022663 [Brachionus plicatilis]|uniref:Uncharacterized protein n=1 Tax=Brachionus plicatilis TaxID=10195 RepID=A0A3M7SIU8_BRAPC|nr:hypothetical protein BpHYR1_022663 [Brachionus plicatilis]
MDNFTIKLILENYEYPDKDFCLFRAFPQNRLLLLTKPIGSFECTCLYIWLIKLYFYDFGLKQLEKFCFNFENKSCDFVSMGKRCHSENFIRIKKNNYHIDAYYGSEILSVFMFYLTPVVSIFGSITNTACLIILKKLLLSDKSQNKQIIFKLMFINCCLNLIFAFIYLCHSPSICAFQNGSDLKI